MTFGLVLMLLNGGHLVFSTMLVLVVVSLNMHQCCLKPQNFLVIMRILLDQLSENMFFGVAAILKCQKRRPH